MWLKSGRYQRMHGYPDIGKEINTCICQYQDYKLGCSMDKWFKYGAAHIDKLKVSEHS